MRSAPCTPAQLGVAACPCAGGVERSEYGATVAWLVDALTADPAELLGRLAAKLTRLAGQQRFEEAADLRDRAAALARALERQRRHDALRSAGRVRVELRGGAWALIEGGVLRGAGPVGAQDALPTAGGVDVTPASGLVVGADVSPASGLVMGTDVSPASGLVVGADVSPASGLVVGADVSPASGLVVGADVSLAGPPIPRHLVDELATIAGWLEARAASLRIVECECGLALPVARLTSFEPRGG